MRTPSLRAVLLAVASLLAFACSDSDTSNLVDAGTSDASTRDAPVPTIDAPLSTTDAPLAMPDAPQFDAPPPPDAPPPVDAFITDAFFVGDAGFTQLKSWSFTMDSEDLTLNFASPGATMEWKADGDPIGSLGFTAITQVTPPGGTVKVISPELTWESWGVPPGARVVYVGLASYKRRLAANSDMDHYWAFQLVGADNLPAHDGLNDAYLEIETLTRVAQPDWETVTEHDMFEVKPAYRASNTPIYVKLWWFPMGTGAIDWRLDEIELELLYVMP